MGAGARLALRQRARGFDVLVLGSLPLLLAPTGTGAVVSLALDGIVLAVLLNRR